MQKRPTNQFGKMSSASGLNANASDENVSHSSRVHTTEEDSSISDFPTHAVEEWKDIDHQCRDHYYYHQRGYDGKVLLDWTFWRIVFRRQLWGSFLVALLFILATGVFYFFIGDRQYFVYTFETGDTPPRDTMDTWYLKPYNTNLIPAWAAIIVPIMLFWLNLCVFELWVMRSDNGSYLLSMISLIHFLLDGLASFFFQQFFQQLFAKVVGEPRPHFYDRCNVGNVGYEAAYEACDSDVFHSFFSGHSSSSMNLGVYYSMYIVWTVYFRASNPVDLTFMGHEASELTAKTTGKRVNRDGRIVDLHVLGERGMKRVWNDVKHGLIMLDMVAGVTWGILIGLTRVTDYAHHPWDVVTGWFVGFLFAFLCFPRAAMLQPYLVAGLKRPSGKTQTVATSNPVPGTATAEGPTVFV